MRKSQKKIAARTLSRLGMSVLLLPVIVSLCGADYYGGDPMPFVRSGLGARAMARGNAATADSMDASGIYWNPGALPYLTQDAFSSQTSILGVGRSWNFISYAHPGVMASGQQYAYGAGWIGFSAGTDIEARKENRPNPDYTFGDTQSEWIFTVATSTSNQGGLGGSLKILNHTLDTDTAGGIGVDLGFWQQPDPMFRYGIVFQDAYSTLTWPANQYVERMPWVIRAGGAYSVWPEKLVGLLETAVQFSFASQKISDWRIHAGLEYSLLPSLQVRAGLDQGRLTAGAGWKFNLGSRLLAGLDYALTGEQVPGAGLTHLFSLNMDILPRVQP